MQLLTTIGAAVYVLGTRRPAPTGRCQACGAGVVLRDPKHYSTRQTPGVADLFAFLPANDGVRQVLFVEVKKQGGRPRPEQRHFRELVLTTAEGHVTGGLDAVIAWLLEHGYLRAGQVPHYRLPAEVGT